MGGSGYRIPTRTGEDGKPLLVPGITTVNNAINMPGLVQWAVNQTAAYAVTHVDDLLSRTEEQGYGFLRYYHTRTPDVDDPELNVHNAHIGVLNDLAELGSKTHDWINDFVNDMWPEDPDTDHQAQMVSQFLKWWDEHDVEPLHTEVTVVGDGYAGTLDHIWKIDGQVTVVDTKTSRKIRETHVAQIAAIGASESMMRQVPADYPDAVLYQTKQWGDTYWIEDVIPSFTQYAFLHLRPDTEDGPAFCRLDTVPQSVVDSGYELFKGALQIKRAQQLLKGTAWLD